MTSQSEHTWFGDRLVAFRAGLLEEAEEQRLRAHLSECEECRKTWDDYVDGEAAGEAGVRHIPSGMIARWDEASETLRGLERAMARQHLEQCNQCKQDLEIMGFEPVLEHVPELELTAEGKTFLHRRGEGREDPVAPDRFREEGRHVIRIVRPEKLRARWGWVNWAFPAWATVATAVALMLFLGRDATRQASPLPEGSTVPWVQPSLQRGGVDQSKLVIPGGIRAMVLAVRVPAGTPSDRDAMIKVFAPEDQEIASVTVTRDQLHRTVVMVPLTVSGELSAGTYRVEFWKANQTEPSTDREESFFELEFIQPQVQPR